MSTSTNLPLDTPLAKALKTGKRYWRRTGTDERLEYSIVLQESDGRMVEAALAAEDEPQREENTCGVPGCTLHRGHALVHPPSCGHPGCTAEGAKR